MKVKKDRLKVLILLVIIFKTGCGVKNLDDGKQSVQVCEDITIPMCQVIVFLLSLSDLVHFVVNCCL